MSQFQIDPKNYHEPSPAIVLHNAKLALRLWKERVTPAEVDLSMWRCKTHACFGGHLAMWPEFRALPRSGSDEDGAPVIRHHYTEGPDMLVEAVLFGDNWMFSPRQKKEHALGSDYDVVVHRLETAIARHGGADEFAEGW